MCSRFNVNSKSGTGNQVFVDSYDSSHANIGPSLDDCILDSGFDKMQVETPVKRCIQPMIESDVSTLIKRLKLAVSVWFHINRAVSQMQALPQACHELTLDYNTLPKLWFIF